MAADPRAVEMFSYYRDAELHGATLLLRLIKLLDAPDAQVKLSLHLAEETHHAWLWTNRIKEMAKDGVSAELLYASLALNQFGLTDAELQEACFRVYNDWMIEYCSHAPDHLLPRGEGDLVDLGRGIGQARDLDLGLGVGPDEGQGAAAGREGTLVFHLDPVEDDVVRLTTG